MILIKTAEEVELLRQSNQLVSRTLAEVGRHVAPGVTTEKLDQVAETFIRDHGAVPGFLGYQGYPKTLCTSVNAQVVHGIPSDKVVLREGDMVSVDCGVIMNGFYGDTAYSFEVGDVSEKVRRLMTVTKECLALGAEQAVEGKRIGDVAQAVQHHAEQNGYSVVREMARIGKEPARSPRSAQLRKKGQWSQAEKGHGNLHRTHDQYGAEADQPGGGRMDHQDGG